KLRVDVEILEEEIYGTDKIHLRIRLKSLRERQLHKTTDGKSLETALEVLEEDALQMVHAWSIDYDYQDGIHRPDVVFVRSKGELTLEHERIIGEKKPMCIKVVDIFGNVVFERME
ncbi:MAG: hypothetical protein IKK48_06120, partial [Firmicutes bacterium]|nr:hypothetical protein [Bacillota bacterium]